MPSLIIPESGLAFGSPPSKRGSTMPTALGLTLTDSVIEEMIRCVQDEKPIQLSLGDHPILHYGTKVQHLSTSVDAFTHELYRSSSSSSDLESPSSSNSHKMATHIPTLNANHKRGVIKVEQTRHPQFLAMFGIKTLTNKKPMATQASKTTMTSTAKASSPTAGADAALAQLQSSMASENAKKAGNTTKYIKDLPLPGQRKGAAAGKMGNKAKFLASNSRLTSDTTRSMPSSPNLSGAGSPSLGSTSVPLSQQQAEQAKATRKPVVHLLALSPMTEVELKMKIVDASNSDIKQALEKVGDFNKNSAKWELRKNFFKELDVWKFEYGSEGDRKRAIDNAVRQYDKLRLGVSEPEWDRLLPKEERGTGKCLSKLQAQIAQGPVTKAPKINVQKVEDSDRDTPTGGEDEDGVRFGDKNLSRLKGESMARSVSQPPATKSKKVSEKEAQAKRFISKNPKTKPKPIPAKEKPTQKGVRVLSAQFVSDSDEEGDYSSLPKTNPKPSNSTKRSREDDGETSDSSIPLSKKVKKETANHRISDSSQLSRTTTNSAYSSSSSKTKGNSPQKSSPLASSPPTNASEFENSSGHTSSSTSPVHSSIKVSRSPIHKRHQKSSSVTSSASSTTSNRSLKPEVMDLARRYRSFYPKYEALHKEVASLGGRRDSEKEQKLLEMHQRLSGMKKDILAGIVEAH